MSGLQFISYEGYGQSARQNYHYSQAVRIGNRIECSGQGGGDPKTNVIYREISAQIDRAFKNVDLMLRDAGGKGWLQAFRVSSYHVPLNDEAQEAMARNFKKWMPNHMPLSTTIGVQRLGRDDMRVEIEAVALDEAGVGDKE